MKDAAEILRHIEEALRERLVDQLVQIARRVEVLSETEACDPEIYFALGYAFYMMGQKGCEDIRNESESWLFRCLVQAPGCVKCVLYIAYIRMDQGEMEQALHMLFSVGDPINPDEVTLGDRLIEARVYCLAHMRYWKYAENCLAWFDQRLKDDPDCGIDLINLMKVIERSDGDDAIAGRVVQKIKKIVKW